MRKKGMSSDVSSHSDENVSLKTEEQSSFETSGTGTISESGSGRSTPSDFDKMKPSGELDLATRILKRKKSTVDCENLNLEAVGSNDTEADVKTSNDPDVSSLNIHKTQGNLKKNTNDPTIPVGYIFGSKMKIPKPLPSASPQISVEFRPMNVNKFVGFTQTQSPLFGEITSSSKLNHIQVMDGEEEDTVILDISAKLYQFDAENKIWKGLGSVNVHLNDCGNEEKYSRIIVRTRDTHRLLVNSRMSSISNFEMRADDEIIMTVDEIGNNKPRIICLKSGQAHILYQEIVVRTDN